MPFTNTQVNIRAKGQNKYANLTINFPDGDFSFLIDVPCIRTTDGGAMVYELLDPNDVEVELVVRKKSAGRKRSTVEPPLDVVENAWGGHGNLNNRAPNTDARNPNVAPEKSGRTWRPCHRHRC